MKKILFAIELLERVKCGPFELAVAPVRKKNRNAKDGEGPDMRAKEDGTLTADWSALTSTEVCA